MYPQCEFNYDELTKEEDSVVYGNLIVEELLSNQPNGAKIIKQHEGQIYLAGIAGDLPTCLVSQPITNNINSPFIFKAISLVLNRDIVAMENLD